MSTPLDYTGERFVPGAQGEVWYEHWHRYHFARHLVTGAAVLDVACGAGYGSALLARGAAQVTGVDVAQRAIEHARTQYADSRNLEFRQADCAALPFADASFDAVVSFETIEHIAAQEAFLDEARRVLRPEGRLILSCPNKLEYSDARSYVNEFHLRELYRDELAAMLAPRFPHLAWFGQRASFFSLIWPERAPATAELFEVSAASAATRAAGHERPMYFIVVASRNAEALASATPMLSVLADRDEWVYRDYEKVMRQLPGAIQRGDTLEGQVTLWQQHHDEAVRQRDGLQAIVTARESDLAAASAEIAACANSRAALDADLAAQRAAQAATEAELAASRQALAAAEAARTRLAGEAADLQREIARRAGLRWWLRLPWHRLRHALRRAAPPA